MSNLEAIYQSLAEEIVIGSTSEGIPKVEKFFNIFSGLAAENGDCPDLTYSPILSGRGYRVDGYAFDIPEGGEGHSGDLYISICAYHQTDSLPTINSTTVEETIKEVIRFIKIAISRQGFDDMEESSNDYRLAMLIRSYKSKIARIRVLVFTNATLKVRKKIFKTIEVGEMNLHTNVFDLERYSKIAVSGTDPVEIDFEENFSGGITCIQASGNVVGYKSYLFAIHGPVLAEIFATYGNRLLEQNVRTYLQAKTKVNRGILKTISDEPSMFFAYNNGLTATASGVKTKRSLDGSITITYIKDFQIVNGGQTTASILYARDGLKLDLSDVFAQVKLSVVEESMLAAIVPKISEYANTQNTVSLADLASNSPSQIRIERLSKEVVVPQKVGSLHASKWFYERARGQYRNLFAYKTQSQKKNLEAEFPKAQIIEKTDLAKFEMSFDGEPYYVAQGAQKCFQRYTPTTLREIYQNDGLNELWYKNMVAKGIIFRTLDLEISRAQWYKDDKGLKAQTVTYSVAACADSFRHKGYQIDLQRIWREQDVPLGLLSWMLDQAQLVHKILTNPPGSVKDPGEFCKKLFCWVDHVKGRTTIPNSKILEYGIPVLDIIAKRAS
jgi:hypothetical protein